MSKGMSYLMFCGVASVIGALTGLGLSFTALSPLVMGGIVGSITPALLTVLCAGSLLHKFFKDKEEEIEAEHKNATAMFMISTAVSAGIGVGLAATAIAIFPGAVLGMKSLALAGAVLGISTFIAGVLTTEHVIDPIVEKVDKYIVSPVAQKASECFSVKHS
ncbi:MAG: hypothetical protein ACR5K9_10015 [Wolbachia sp.]